MKRSILVILCVIYTQFFCVGQEVKEGTIKMGKQEQKGYIAQSKYTTSQVEEVIAQKLHNAGLDKAKRKSKFYTYKGVTVNEISPNKIDIYYKVQKRKKRSTIYFLVSKGYDNYVTSENDGVISANITTFLTSIDSIAEHNEAVRLKEEEVMKMDKKLEEEKKDVEKAEKQKAEKTKELNDLKQNKG